MFTYTAPDTSFLFYFSSLLLFEDYGITFAPAIKELSNKIIGYNIYLQHLQLILSQQQNDNSFVSDSNSIYLKQKTAIFFIFFDIAYRQLLQYTTNRFQTNSSVKDLRTGSSYLFNLRQLQVNQIGSTTDLAATTYTVNTMYMLNTLQFININIVSQKLYLYTSAAIYNYSEVSEIISPQICNLSMYKNYNNCYKISQYLLYVFIINNNILKTNVQSHISYINFNFTLLTNNIKFIKYYHSIEDAVILLLNHNSLYYVSEYYDIFLFKPYKVILDSNIIFSSLLPYNINSSSINLLIYENKYFYLTLVSSLKFNFFKHFLAGDFFFNNNLFKYTGSSIKHLLNYQVLSSIWYESIDSQKPIRLGLNKVFDPAFFCFKLSDIPNNRVKFFNKQLFD